MGMISKYATPLELSWGNSRLRNAAVLLFSARGRNPDALAAFKSIVSQEPKEVMIICNATDSPLAYLSRDFQFVQLFEANFPSGKDGFLATKSLLATALLLVRAYWPRLREPNQIPPSLERLVYPDSSKAKFIRSLKLKTRPIVEKRTLVVLHGRWSKAAAYDLESKCTEGGLANVQLADYRNFAHGRHHWLTMRGKETGVLLLSSAEDEGLADRTSRLIPDEIAIAKISTRWSGPLAAVSLMTQALYLVGIIGDALRIDPGKPRVPSYGSRLYHLWHTLPSRGNYRSSLSAWEAIAIGRKIDKPLELVSRDDLEGWKKAYNRFLTDLQLAHYGGIVLDYDGTLCERSNRFSGPSKLVERQIERLLDAGIIVGIATGRGKSVKRDLRKIISKKHWGDLLIGYYNGTDIGTLGDDSHPDLSGAGDPAISILVEVLKAKYQLPSRFEFEIRPKQITFQTSSAQNIDSFLRLLWAIVQQEALPLQILESTHTIDAIPTTASKLEVVASIEAKLSGRKDSAILCVGDKGSWPGNDYALLSTKYSLSVDAVSADPTTCWNIAPIGHKGTQASVDYLRAMISARHSVTFDTKRM